MQQRRRKPNARKRVPTIDIHAHFVPEEYLRLIEAEGEPHGVRLRPGPNGPLIVVGQVAIGPITAHYHDLDLRLKAMDAQKVAVHALSLMPPMVYWADGPLGLPSYYLHNLLGNPFDTAVAAANLIFSGLLDRFPKLNICLPHAGGAFPYLIGRLNHGWKVRQECKALKRPPSSYLRRFTYDTISHAPESLRYLINLVGADRVMLGSDYCFDMGYERPVKAVTALKLSRNDEEKILGGNAARMLRLR